MLTSGFFPEKANFHPPHPPFPFYPLRKRQLASTPFFPLPFSGNLSLLPPQFAREPFILLSLVSIGHRRRRNPPPAAPPVAPSPGPPPKPRRTGGPSARHESAPAATSTTAQRQKDTRGHTPPRPPRGRGLPHSLLLLFRRRSRSRRLPVLLPLSRSRPNCLSALFTPPAGKKVNYCLLYLRTSMHFHTTTHGISTKSCRGGKVKILQP